MGVTVLEAQEALRGYIGGCGYIRLYRLLIDGRYHDLQIGIFFD